MKIKLLLCMLLFTAVLQAQTTAIPDPNFEQALIDLGFDTMPINGFVPTSNIDGIISLDISGRNIIDLTGIEDFTALASLNCSNNNISSINLNDNTELNILNCSNNDLSNLDVSANSLANLFCFDNPITTLDISNNPVLVILNCANTLISSLDVSNKLNLDLLFCNDNSLLTVLDTKGANNLSTVVATNNPNLSCINVDDASAATSNVGIYASWSEDASATYSEHCFETNIPDDNFEQALIDLGYDTVLDNYVLTNNINSITDLNVSFKNISDLTGIEDFTELISLNCQNNQLITLSISNNTNLEELLCQSNQLTSLDVTNNLALLNFQCSGNQIGDLDLSNNINLIVLICFNNPLGDLDVSNNPNLITLTCYLNQLTSLDLSNNNSIQNLDCVSNQITQLNLANLSDLIFLRCSNNLIIDLDLTNNIDLASINFTNNSSISNVNIKNGTNNLITTFNGTNCPLLECIQVDNEMDAISGTGSYSSWIKDNNSQYGEHCLDTFIPDDNFEQALINLGYDSGPLDDYVLTSNIEIIEALNIENENIIDLTGIEDFRDLEELRCRNNLLTVLDLSENANINFLRLEDNLLESLNLKNGNNSIMTTMRAGDNNLICIDVDDEIAANNGSGSYSSWQVDNGVMFSENCTGCPEIDLLGNGISIANGDDTPNENDNTDFGLVDFGSFTEFTFTIENLGVADLSLAGTPLITITNSSDFEVVEFPNNIITANGGTTVFTIRYTPSMVNTINTAIVSFMSDDCDNAIYSFDIVGQSQEPLFLEENHLNKLSIYPNPSNGVLNIKHPSIDKLDKLRILDVTGKILNIVYNKNFNNKLLRLNIPTGIYFLEIRSGSSKVTKKIIVK